MAATDLAAELGVSLMTVHRWMAEDLEDSLLWAGQKRSRRYALRRALRGSLAAVPLYEIDEEGHATSLSELSLVSPQGSFLPLRGSRWPVPRESRDGWWDGLPYPLCDMRPQGYLGRRLAIAQHRTLSVPEDPQEWSDDDIVHVLSRAVPDPIGNLILGEESYRRWLEQKLEPDVVPEASIGSSYLALAESALDAGIAGSSAAGEFPKFTALRRQRSKTAHVIVKFSGVGQSAAERRWADLLMCEHLALDCVKELPNLSGAETRIVEHGGRVFLEGERFDRIGLHGRRPVCTLESLNLNGAFLGLGTGDWNIHVTRLHELGLLEREVVNTVPFLRWFGHLIGNTDMHLGNLSFFVGHPLRLTPAYDMLPMMYAPLRGGEVSSREFKAPLPVPPQRDAWHISCATAIRFWSRASEAAAISPDFRAICGENAKRLRGVAKVV
jgi:hypothetical protein